ncbi:RING finger and CHY zinc finger domain-containing protein 1-like [Montipora capricornis]|uniref:RING finger and CHY zinc finger domain-containing protein 1-like n=1 Tax=Montipora capricornis TaxID=246305 RepID=UPI0035F16F98
MSASCEHYLRRCALLAPCCNKHFSCRLCHDDSEDHKLDRKSVQQIKCLQCESCQMVASHCKDCGIKFGRYFCGICRLFDDFERGQFHCNGCGICRVGGEENFFHCTRCDMCLGIQLKDSHKCVEKSSRSDCPICYEDIHTSRIPAHVPPCGHLLHSICFSNLLESGGYACPICNRSMVDMRRAWRMLDNEISRTPMPEEYNNFYVKILCRDCNKESKIRFHVVGLKCAECGSYNTSREGEEGIPVAAVQLAQAAQGQGDEEWETEDEEETFEGHEETESEQQASVNDLVNLSEVQLNLDDETGDDHELPLD